MATPNSLSRSIQGYLDGLFDRDIVLIPNPMKVDGNVVTWAAPASGDQPFVDFLDYATISTYRRWAVTGEYSAMLFDGALLQMRYVLDGSNAVSHRLAYVPCPYRLDPQMLLTESLSDLLDLHQAGEHSDITMQSAIRFDFDLGAAGPRHPASHLTFNVASCRIACEAPMRPSAFLKFVFEHFYSAIWDDHASYFATLPTEHWPSTAEDEHRLLPHVAWRSVPPAR